MGYPTSWITIDNASQILLPFQNIDFSMTVNVPTGTPEGEYFLKLKFLGTTKAGTNVEFEYPDQHIIIDNSNPNTPEFSAFQSSYAIKVYSWSSYDSYSNLYTTQNHSSGLNGIKEYIVRIERPDGTFEESQPYNALESYPSHTFNQLQSMTSYKVSVKAIDLVGNSNTLQQVLNTAPAPPSISVANTSYCSIQLQYHSVGASSYKIYDATNLPATLLASTSSTEYTVSGIAPGVFQKFYAVAVSGAGLVSDVSTTVSATTLIIPFPNIVGPDVVCNSTAQFSVNNLTSGLSLDWSSSSNFSLGSINGSTVNYNVNGAGQAWVTATFSVCSGSFSQSKQKMVWSGAPSRPEISPATGVTVGLYDDIRFWITSSPGASSGSGYWWSSGALYPATSQYGNECWFSASKKGSATVYVTTSNICGISPTRSRAVMVLESVGGTSYAFSPNPVTNQITVEKIDKETASKRAILEPVATFEKTTFPANSSEEYTIEIWHEKNGKIMSVNSTKNAETLNLSKLPKGYYYLHIITPTAIYKETFIKE